MLDTLRKGSPGVSRTATSLATPLLLLALSNPAPAQPVLVEGGHTLNLIVQSVPPSSPSAGDLDTLCSFGNDGNIESIAVDSATGMLYVQVLSEEGSFRSDTTCIFAVSPAGVVTLVNADTGFGINSRGTDMHFDAGQEFLVTQDQNSTSIGAVTPAGAVLKYSDVTPPIWDTSTFGMDFSAGVGSSDVPAGDIVFTGDEDTHGIHSAFYGGLGTTLHVTPAQGGGDDMVIQPDGDWVHVGDFTRGITAYSPDPAHIATPSPTGLTVQDMFENAGLPFSPGSRASVCDTNGHLYVSYSAYFGGSGIFRVDETLTTATHVVTVPGPLNDPVGPLGLHDLTVAPSSAGVGSSVYFTVHDLDNQGEEVWEMDRACLEVEADIDIKFCSNPNAFNCKKKGKTPVTIFGTASFDVTDIDLSTLRLCLASDPADCTTTPPKAWSIADRGDPTTDLGASQCAVIEDAEQDFLNPDTFDDLDVAFDSREIAALIGCPLSKNQASPTLIVRGSLNDGTELFSTPVGNVGIDQLIRKGGKP